MIQIDIPMPKRCAECPYFNDAIYGKCQVKDTWFGAEDSEWVHKERPNWCPMNNEGVKDENTDSRSML